MMEFPSDIKVLADGWAAVDEVGLVINGWTGVVVNGGAPSFFSFFFLFAQPVQQAAR